MRIAEAAAAGDLARVTLGGEILYMARQPMVRFGKATVGLPAGGFLQASAGGRGGDGRHRARGHGRGERGSPTSICGSGAFAFRLAEQANVLAADAGRDGDRGAEVGAGLGARPAPILAEARDLERRPILVRELKRIEAVLFDPPRAGALEQAQQIAESGCQRRRRRLLQPRRPSPATPSCLIEGGFRLETVTPIPTNSSGLPISNWSASFTDDRQNEARYERTDPRGPAPRLSPGRRRAPGGPSAKAA